jgi:exopolyphosphatase/guanosine-5'-triphosphate,3'-diphosphate pyrophosphatase
MKLAALDLGSNSFHLLVAETDADSELKRVGSRKEMLRLGSTVQDSGQLSDAVFELALGSVARLSDAARQLGAKKLTTAATSAIRDARNGAAFCAACADRFGVEVELLSGEDEARLAYLGARSAIRARGARVLVCDVGGGSVELAAGVDENCDTVSSLPLGFLRLSRAFPIGEPGGPERIARYVQLELEKCRWQLGRFDTLLLSGGTARAIGKLERPLEPRVCARARKVADELQARGVRSITLEAMGHDLPVASNSSENGREKNRRVEVWLR